MRNPIIVALDVSTADQALALAREVAPAVGGFKIGLQLFTAAGPDIVKQVRDTGANVFLDLKLHDIPNTVAHAVAAAVKLEVQMLTLHASGGTEMMRAAESSAHDAARAAGVEPPLVLGVTVLTSMDRAALSELGWGDDVGRQVDRLAGLAARAGLRGLVCSPLELTLLRQSLPARMQLVTPGIRAPGDEPGDQKRTLSAREAMEAGASWLVIGRPISQAKRPRHAAEAILDSLS